MPEKFGFSPENTISNHTQKYQDVIDQSLESILAQVPTIPEKQRRLEKLGEYGYKMKLKETMEIPESHPVFPEDNPGLNDCYRSTSLEYFFDFDDTIFNYSGYDQAVKQKLEQLGIPTDVIDKFYEEAKVASPTTGKKMFQQQLFLDRLKMQFLDKAADIENVYSDTQPKEFLHKDMAKLLHILTASAVSRVHILTYGEVNFQRQKIEAVLSELGKPMDILYAQVPKAEFLEQYLKDQYPYMKSGTNNVQSFMMIDDNPEELKKLVEFSKKQPFFIPIRLRKPSAKRHHIEQTGEKAYEVSDRCSWALIEASAATRLSRKKKITAEQWQEAGLVQKIQSDIDESMESPNQVFFDVRQTDRGTLLLTRKIKDYPGSNNLLEIKNELIIDDSSKIVYEIDRDDKGEIQEKRQFTWHSDILK